jgi:lysophospholipase L1-like esterase
MNKKIIYTVASLIGVTIIYFTVKKFFGKKVQPVGSVLFVGDSITAIEYKGKPVISSYPNVIKKELEPKGVKVDVLAESGKGTDWLFTNLTEKLKSNKYDRVYVYGGINDMFSGVSKQRALQNVQKMVDLIKSKGAEPFVIIGYDAKKFMDENKLKPTTNVPTKAGMIELKNKYIDYQNSIKTTIKNATIVDKFNIPSSMTSDAIHPTPSGQKIIANGLLQDLLKNI